MNRSVVGASLLAAVLLTGCTRLHPGQPTTVSVSGLAASGQSGQPTPRQATDAARCGAPATVNVVVRNAFGVAVNPVTGQLAYNARGADGLWHIYLANADGSDPRRFGLGSASFPTRTTGSPVWSPDGHFIAFVAEKAVHPGNSAGSTPGWGGYSDIWIATADGLDAWRVTDVPDDANHGVLIPEFSPNGRLLEWSERTRAPALWNPVQVAGFWVIQVAHFVVAANGTPTVTGAQTIDPGGNAFNETGGFSPDSTTIAFTSDFETHNFWTNQIYTINLATGRIVQLTRGRDYNEHPRYTPDGRVVWMAGNRQPGNHSGTDWWVMNANGSDQQRLTDLNDRSSPQYFGQTVYATVVQTSNWSADGHSFVADLELSLLTSNSDIVRVQLTCR